MPSRIRSVASAGPWRRRYNQAKRTCSRWWKSAFGMASASKAARNSSSVSPPPMLAFLFVPWLEDVRSGRGHPESRPRAHEAGRGQEGREGALAKRTRALGVPAERRPPGAPGPARERRGEGAGGGGAGRLLFGQERRGHTLALADPGGEPSVHEGYVSPRRPHRARALDLRPGQRHPVWVRGIGGRQDDRLRLLGIGFAQDAQALEGARMSELRAPETGHEITASHAARLLEALEHRIERPEPAGQPFRSHGVAGQDAMAREELLRHGHRPRGGGGRGFG